MQALPLFFVQAVDTASIAVTALASRYIMDVRLKVIEYKLIAILLVGLAILAYSATPETAIPVSNSFRYSLLYVAIILAAGALQISTEKSS